MFRITRLLIIIIVAGLVISPFPALSGNLMSLDLHSEDIICVSCALNIKKNIGRVEGVKKVEVSARTKRIHIEYDEGVLKEGQIIEIIEKLGYGVEKVDLRN